MPYPILTLQDVDPRFNETAISNNAEVMQQAQQIRYNKTNIKKKNNDRTYNIYKYDGRLSLQDL